jgi:hypothetical protein
MLGQQDIRELAVAAFSALAEAELDEALDELQARVLRRDCTELFQTTIREGTVECSLNPMVELLLRHVIDISGKRELSRDERNQEIVWALEISGF